MENYKNRKEYEEVVIARSGLPKGFRVGVVPLTFFPKEKRVDDPFEMNLSLILLDNKTESFAGVFTKNSFPGHPVIHGKKVLENSHVQGVLVNNKISNVRCPGGLEDIDSILTALSKEFSINKNLFFSSSTGIIGWNLPVKSMTEVMGQLPGVMDSQNIFQVAKGIMTTDNYPKVRSCTLNGGRIVAIAKGAGMIEPNMATMLVFILTDIIIERESLREIFKRVIGKTFNRISVDSDQSTSDTGLIFSSNLVDGVSHKEFEESLYLICSDLSQDIVRNGEGTAHVIEVNVKGASNKENAIIIGKGIINAPLVKAAVFGNDPNLGRIIQAIGDATGNNDILIDPEKVTVSMGGNVLYQGGEFQLSEELESKMSKYLKERALSEKATGYPEHRNNVEIVVDLNSGDESAVVYGSDLSYEYVRENADYRS